MEYDEEIERRMMATKQVPAPKGKREPTVPEPLYSGDELLYWLGLRSDPSGGATALADDPVVSAMAADILSGRADWLHGATT